MNIFEIYKKKIQDLVSVNYKNLNIDPNINFEGVVIEVPPQKFNFDLSSNIALVLAKRNKQSPVKLANLIKDTLLRDVNDFSEVAIAGPGFINFRFNSKTYQKLILDILSSNNKYGSSSGSKKKYNIEFVSANPTGPMHIGHSRGAIYGDVLANLLKFNGHNVIKEYYINDYGNQITNFTKSVFFRLREIRFKEKFVNKENLYPGEYVVDIAKKILIDIPKIDLTNFEKVFPTLSEISLKYSMILIKDDLKSLGICHDNFVSEKSLVEKDLVTKTIKYLQEKSFVEKGYLDRPKGEEAKNWKKTKRLIFKSTLFGDDTDRALQKNDGTWTYFANDIAYHADKVSRDYDYLINILGADHTGYIKRITAATSALSNDKISLICRVCQLVKLFKNGQPYKMSKRAGDFISVKEFLNEVDKDSVRFMMLNRSNDVEIDFDFDKVLEKTRENPVFYVQYSYARISSLFRILNIDANKTFLINENNFELNSHELNLFRKILDWPKVVETASVKFEPHRIPFYLYELATLFHSYWSKGNEDSNYKFIIDGKIKNSNTLLIIKLVAITIENGMRILGVSLPSKM
ncbi:MAG: arginyl-tRNA synthetase [Pelagibacterales bacterium]|nr:arginyl-tRNA synthetase [Pelagibacterales bacterium]|tara:strand:+ start:3502 stop:5229 length:1728 start_codon:yes stop_codon:yes gene_type:complete